MFTPSTYPVIRIVKDSIKTGIQMSLYDSSIPKLIYLCSEEELAYLIAEGYLPSHALADETYIVSPYGEKQYIQIQNYETYVMNRKAHHIAMIAAQLGASGCTYSIEFDSVQKRELSASLDAKYLGYANFDSAYQNQIEKKIKNEISVQQQYIGKIPSADDYEEAVKYARIHNLLEDNSVEQLLNGRNPYKNNWCMACEIKVHLCEELNKRLDIAANLAVMSDALSFNGDFLSIVLRKIEAILKFEYSFPVPK